MHTLPFAFSIFAASAPTYLNVHGRLFWEVSTAAYCDDELLKPWACSQCNASGANVTHLTIVGDARTDARGYVGVLRGAFGLPPAIVISFRGSSTLINWIENLRTSKVPDLPAICDGCLVHKGFHMTWESIAAPIVTTVRALRHLVAADAPIFVVGHSMGKAAGPNQPS